MAVAETSARPDGSPSDRPRTDRNGLEVLDEASCYALLACSPIGRVAYLAGGRARVVPINIAVRDRTVLFRVGTGGLLAAIEDRQLLTIETDEIDADSCRGWSVIVTGVAKEIARRPDQSPPAVCSWLRSDATRLVRLTPLEISGRRLPTDEEHRQ